MALIPVHWYYNTESGQLTQGNNLENLANNLFGGLGWHELNIPGNATAAQAEAEARKEFPTGKTPTTAGITPGSIASATAGNLLGGLGSITFGGLSGTNILIRAAKMIIGSVIMLIGLAKLTGLQSGLAVKAVKAAPFL